MLRVFCAVILLLGSVGMLFHSQLIPTGRIRAGMFAFYTNQSNLVVLLYQLLLLIATFFPGSPYFRIITLPELFFSVMLCIFVTHLIYHFVLAPQAMRSGKGFEDGKIGFGNLCVHYLVPWLTVLEWCVCADKAQFYMRCVCWWLLVPTAYLTYVLLRARTGRPIGHTRLLYPYPFMDLPKLGAKKFWRNIAGLILFFFSLGSLMLGVGKLLLLVQ